MTHKDVRHQFQRLKDQVRRPVTVRGFQCALKPAFAEMYISGVSTRKVVRISE